MLILIACEESQRICIEMRKRGHKAFSCDIIECSGGHPEWHIQCDVSNVLNGNTRFFTQNGDSYYIKGQWDLIIAHPPCTRLCSSGQRWLYTNDKNYNEKKRAEQDNAIQFFMMFVNYAEHNTNVKMAIENPIGIMSTKYRKPDCIYNPYDFEGETECKKTCLWLFNLPKLKPTQILPKEKRTQNIWKSYFDGKFVSYNSPECARLRSQTPMGVAKAIAEQWG